MEITGRVVANAEVRNVSGDRKVTGFRIAINDTYKTKAGEKREETTYVDCSYWMNSGIAEYLKKGKLVELYGRLGVNAWIGKDGEAHGAVTFHVFNIKLLGGGGTRNEK